MEMLDAQTVGLKFCKPTSVYFMFIFFPSDSPFVGAMLSLHALHMLGKKTTVNPEGSLIITEWQGPFDGMESLSNMRSFVLPQHCAELAGCAKASSGLWLWDIFHLRINSFI